MSEMLKGLDSRTQEIYEPVIDKLLDVESRLRNLGQAESPYLTGLLDYVLQAGGKRVRPAITLLASMFHPYDHDNPVTMAAAVELLHIATLIHDDTVDNSALRRGRATVSDRWGKDVAVLIGDYVFATSATFVCDTNNIRVIRRFSETIMELSSGELLEYFNTNNWKQKTEDYSDRIYRKTSSLFRTSAETGALLSGAPEEAVQALDAYGYNLGMAFQVVDDILDVEGDANQIGKPVGNDLLQGVLTLPGIMLLERFPDSNPIKDLFGSENNGNGERLREAVAMIQNSDIIDDCYSVARGYCNTARDSLAGLPQNPGRDSLEELTRYVMERNR